MTSDNPTAEPGKRRIRGGALVALAVPVLLVGYVASIGPASVLCLYGWIPGPVYQVAYGPIIWLSHQSDTLREPLEAWSKLCWEWMKSVLD